MFLCVCFVIVVRKNTPSRLYILEHIPASSSYSLKRVSFLFHQNNIKETDALILLFPRVLRQSLRLFQQLQLLKDCYLRKETVLTKNKKPSKQTIKKPHTNAPQLTKKKSLPPSKQQKKPQQNKTQLLFMSLDPKMNV